MKPCEKHRPRFRRILAAFLAAFVLSAALTAPAVQAQAASSVTAPKGIRIGVGPQYQETIRVEVPSANRSIKNITVTKNGEKTKDLQYKLTHVFDSSGSSDSMNCWRGITVYAKKAGAYKLKFDICIGARKTNSRTVIIYASANHSNVLKDVSFNGRSVFNPNIPEARCSSTCVPYGKSGTLKFKPLYGVTIKSIEMSYYNKNGKQVKKSFRNGSTVSLSNVALKTQYNKPFLADTVFRITYTDKYTGNGEFSFTIKRFAGKWV